MTKYAEFLASKAAAVPSYGHRIDPSDVHPFLHPWQAEVVAWAVEKGRAALWEDTGLGKTVQALEWARLSGDTALIVAPLAVCQQTAKVEAPKVDLDVRYVRGQDQVTGPGIWITNYEMVDHFDPRAFDAMVLDESSILKNETGKTRTKLIRHFAPVPRRLSCTATPAPNDPEELTSQAEFLGVCSRSDMLATYFINDGLGWRPKRHAVEAMYRWLATWATALRRPSDLGYDDAGYILPGLEIIPELLPVNVEVEGQLFATDIGGVGGRAAVRRQTLDARCERAVDLVNAAHWQRSSAKLAACRGSQSTPPTVGPSTAPILPNGSGARHRGDPLRPTANTCASTTDRTERSSSNIDGRLLSGEMPGDESATPATRNTARSASGSLSFATKSRSATTGSASRSVSLPSNTTSNLSCKEEGAPSAELDLAMKLDGDSLSTTAIRAADSAVSSAASATSASGNSATIPSFSAGPSNTYSGLEPWIVWCGLNDEQEYIARTLGDRCFSVTGSMSPEDKADLMMRWVAGERPVLVTKPKIAGFGMNFQHCAEMAFVGLSDSYEAYYQAIRRCYRYGQPRVVHAHVVLSELEAQIAQNVARKERDSTAIMNGMVRAMQRARDEELIPV